MEGLNGGSGRRCSDAPPLMLSVVTCSVTACLGTQSPSHPVSQLPSYPTWWAKSHPCSMQPPDPTRRLLPIHPFLPSCLVECQQIGPRTVDVLGMRVRVASHLSLSLSLAPPPTSLRASRAFILLTPVLELDSVPTPPRAGRTIVLYAPLSSGVPTYNNYLGRLGTWGTELGTGNGSERTEATTKPGRQTRLVPFRLTLSHHSP